MRFFFLLFFLTAFPFLLLSQERKDFGVIVGTSYYMGDYNPGSQFYQPSPLMGLLGRYNFNPFYSARLMLGYGWLKGSHNVNDFFLPGNTPPFSKKLVMLELDAEINLISFDSRKTFSHEISPYLVIGLGAAFDGGTFFSHIPLGFGVKYSPVGRLTLGAEWILHKTFNDMIDDYSNVTDPEKRKSFIHNNDWFGIAGIFVTYRLYSQSALCPAYR